MPQGKVKWFNNAKGYGFIIADEAYPELANEDLFVHFSSIRMEGYKTLKAGQRVQFEIQPSGKGLHAIEIVPLDDNGKPITPQVQPASEETESATEADKALHI